MTSKGQLQKKKIRLRLNHMRPAKLQQLGHLMWPEWANLVQINNWEGFKGQRWSVLTLVTYAVTQAIYCPQYQFALTHNRLSWSIQLL